MRRLIILSVTIIFAAAFFASSNRDGLEKVAKDLSFIGKAEENTSLFMEYSTPKIKNKILSTLFAGIAGITIILFFFWGIKKMIILRHKNKTQ